MQIRTFLSLSDIGLTVFSDTYFFLTLYGIAICQNQIDVVNYLHFRHILVTVFRVLHGRKHSINRSVEPAKPTLMTVKCDFLQHMIECESIWNIYLCIFIHRYL